MLQHCPEHAVHEHASPVCGSWSMCMSWPKDPGRGALHAAPELHVKIAHCRRLAQRHHLQPADAAEADLQPPGLLRQLRRAAGPGAAAPSAGGQREGGAAERAAGAYSGRWREGAHLHGARAWGAFSGQALSPFPLPASDQCNTCCSKKLALTQHKAPAVPAALCY